ncbi:hypothetical protein [Streptococcus gallolyticus]|uniref:hypothetical protein n=1 Tax=Streptococcus gallolyticus TaxID=315405 RepID=UPI000E41E2D3|nr:hypothetical protein [Streptococcus gallolyticus]RGC38202.1 hypothetical protein DXD73_08630 [Streptococcus gallolyticus]
MIQQEINLPLPLMLLLMVAMIILLIIVAKQGASETIELPKEQQEDNNAVQERYGTYIQSQGHYWN